MRSPALLAVVLSSSIAFSLPLESPPAQHINNTEVELSKYADLHKRAMNWYDITISAACVCIYRYIVGLIA
jgi:hypothetical protein